MRPRRLLVVTAVAALAVVPAAVWYATAQQIEEAKRSRAITVDGARYHVLPATLETTQWGWLDPKEPPKLVVDSGDVVAVETMMHAHNKIQPGSTMEEIVALRKANPGGGPMSVTGPIYVNGAQPGDVMEVAILKIVPKAFAVNLTGLECSYREIVMRLTVRRDMTLQWPRLESPTHWITVGFDEDLNKAMVNATREAVDLLATQKMVPLTRYEAYSLVSMVGDCRVSQVVDVRKGVHCMIPKAIFATKS